MAACCWVRPRRIRNSLSDWPSRETVSYTHLEVYKRQDAISADIAAVEAQLEALRSPEAAAEEKAARTPPKRRPLPP